LYAELETLIADEAIIASNTSGLPPDALAQKLRHPERLLIAHFWHPPHLIPLVEVVPGSATTAQYWREVSTFAPPARWKRWCSIAPRRVCRQPAAVRPAARSAAYRPQRHCQRRGGGSGDARLAGSALCDGRPAGSSGYDRLATVQDICQHLLPELASGSEMMSLVAEKWREAIPAPAADKAFTAGMRRASVHPVAPASTALCPEALISRSVPYNNNERSRDECINCPGRAGLLMLAAYRGYSVILFAPIAALGAVLLTDPARSARPLPACLWKKWSVCEALLPGVLAGRVFGKLIELSGFSRSIVAAAINILGRRHAIR
jgi:hypothetical protein